MMNWADIEAVVYSEADNPHDIMGCKGVAGGTLIQTFQPGAKKIKVKIEKSKMVYEMEEADEAGYFAVIVKEKGKFSYSFLVEKEGEKPYEVKDPYCFTPTLTKKETEKLNEGILYNSYEYLGAHVRKIDGVKGVAFAVWAPNALRVSVVGDFNQWDGRVNPMRRLWDSGVFEIFIPGVKKGDLYKYELKLKTGLCYLKADPYAFGMELRPGTASIVRDISNYPWKDKDWCDNREQYQSFDKPMSIYEVHLGSFMKPEEEGSFLNYREIAKKLCDYVKEIGYTHVELMPIMEHPLDESWGYQVIGYYAPTRRYGTPEDFMYFMNYMHERGIGVIIDWVPAHFPRDTQGLSNFDGTCLYEHLDERQGSHPHWGTLIYNYGRPEVSNYLLSNALFWANMYHVDGIRMDAVASMLYLDYGKSDGEWIANMYGGKENLEAMEFLKHLNSVFHKENPHTLLIAEESTAWPKVTGQLKEDGLGFDYKWNMGWMNDFTGYMKLDPYFRTYHYGELTFSMIYAYSEKFILVFSHDEVVHGKASMIGKMPGTKKEKFGHLRSAYGYMMAHPGKKLLFMGQDIGEFDEWSEKRSVQWELLEHEEHKQLKEYVKDLHTLYKSNPAFYELDHDSDGFEWINNISANENIVVFLRKTKREEDTLLVVCNFENIPREDYKIGVPGPGKYKEIFNSDAEKYGGDGFINPRLKQSKKDECDDRPDSIRIKVPPMGMTVFSYTQVNEEVKGNKSAKEKKENAGEGKNPLALKEKLSKKFETEEPKI